MITLNRFAKNPFKDLAMSMNELYAGATDHLQRMVAQNPGNFLAGRIAETTVALAATRGCVSSDLVKLGLRKGRKLAKDQFREALPAAITKIHAGVVAEFGPKAPEVLECFSQGRSIFQQVTDDVLGAKLAATSTAITARVAQLGATLVADMNALHATWSALYAASESSSGAKTMTEADKKAAKAGLQAELFKNLLTIALAYPEDQAKVDLYFQQYLFQDRKRTEVSV